MGNKVVHNVLENLDGYLLSIKRNVDTGLYELEVGFRPKWIFKNTEDVELEIINESENGTLAIVKGKDEDVCIDDLIEYVNKVINTNQKITEMQEDFKRQIEKQKEELADKIVKLQESSSDYDDDKPTKKSTKKKEESIVIDDEEVAEKIN